MLPDPDHDPSLREERLRVVPVTLHRSLQLRPPVRTIHLGLPPVDRARMPKAAIDKNGHSSPSKDDVSTNPALSKIEAQVASKPIPESMELRTEREFGDSVSSADRAHVARPSLRGGLRSGYKLATAHNV